jgi:hypothetical protein
VQCDNGSASNAISAQIFKTLVARLPDKIEKKVNRLKFREWKLMVARTKLTYDKENLV